MVELADPEFGQDTRVHRRRHNRRKIIDRLRRAQGSVLRGPARRAQDGEHAAQFRRRLPSCGLNISQRSPTFRIAVRARGPGCCRSADGDQAETVGYQVMQVAGDAEPFILRGLLRRPLLQVSLVVASFRAGLECRADGQRHTDPDCRQHRSPRRDGTVDADRQHRAQHHGDGDRRGEPCP